jgi:catechol 2,3-dioxygenase-like lactoylglutathione lyase family enzyme
LNFLCVDFGADPAAGASTHPTEAMRQSIGYVSVLVRDYDEAIAYYTGTLGFHLREDTPLGAGKRWVLVVPPEASECALLLARAVNEEQRAAIGHQAGGRVFLFLHTDDFWRDYRAFCARGVQFHEPPREEPYGTVAVFTDLYGNRWDLLQLSERRARI